MSNGFAHLTIENIELSGGVMVVKFTNGTAEKFIDVKDWQYNQIMSAKNPSKELDHFARYIPHHPISKTRE